MEKQSLIVSSSPHARTDDSTRMIMLDVIIALAFSMVAAVLYFGPRALTVTAVSVASCVVFEYFSCRIMGRKPAIKDLSAVVTGLLLAYCLPVAVPLWMPVIGAFFAIVIVKQLYGGLGKNFMNPALAARAFLFSWGTIMTSFTSPSAENLPMFSSVDAMTAATDAVSAATPLKALKTGMLPEADLWQMFRGDIAGCIGEVSTALILCGLLYLLIRKVVTLHIPLAFVGTVALLTFVFPRGDAVSYDLMYRLEWMLNHLLSGGLMLGAVFMATDYSTSPVTRRGQVLFGVGCGALTVFIRYFGGYPEGVCYAILIMNSVVWLLDKAGMPRRFGVRRFDAVRARFRRQAEGGENQ